MASRISTQIVFWPGLAWLLLLVVARSGQTARPWPIELLDTFALYAFIPFLAAGLAALLLRSRLLLLLLVGATAFFWHEFGHLFAPRPAVAAQPGPTLRVLTYNVLWSNHDAGPLMEIVDAEQPDVIALQELTIPYAEDLRRRAAGRYPYSTLADVGNDGDGGGVFSRLPILHARELKLSPDGHAVQHVELAWGQTKLALFNVHLESPRLRTTNPPGPIPVLVLGFGSADREREIERLVAETRAVDVPFVLAGDFNLAAGSRPYRQLPPEWRDAFGERGWGFGHTFPNQHRIFRRLPAIPLPLVRIDYVFSSPDLVPGRAWVPGLAGSDHLPLLAEVQWVESR